MKQFEEETKMKVSELTHEEMQNISGGSWWEVRFINGEIWLIFHPR